MKITSREDLYRLFPLLGKNNVEFCEKALENRADIWFFMREDYVPWENNLTKDEQQLCIRCLDDVGMESLIVMRGPKPVEDFPVIIVLG